MQKITPNTLTEKIVPSEGHPNNQKSKITKTVNGKENKAKVFPSKNLQTANQKKDTSIHKNVISKADSISSDDVFKTPIRLNSRSGVLRIESEVNISLSKPASTKKYKRTPYKSFPQSEIFYSDDEVCLKSPAVRKSRTSFKTADKRATPGISDFLTSTSDSGGSFQCVTMRRPHNISGTRSIFMSTSDSGTPGSIDSETPKSSEISEIFDSPSIKMSLRSRLRKRENFSAQNEPSCLKNSESRKSLRTSTRNRGSSSIKSTNKSSANRKSHIQKSTPSSEPESSDPDGCETKSKPVTTPDAKNPRLSSSNTETPDQKGSVPSAVYVSPFVTISRGKNSARKEYQVRKSTGGTLPGAEAATSPKAGAKRLIEECQRGGDERTVTCQDLHGFWDMVFLQVEDVDKRFNNLNKLKENNWREIITEKKVVRTKRQRKTKAKASSRIKEMIDAARRKKGQEQQGTSMPSPSSSLTKPTGSVRRSLRASLLTNQLQQKRRKSSPGLVMMNVSQMIKSNDGLTPCKSILKNNRQSKSEKRITKTVLFKEDLEDEKI
nr:unnamed protein product [Callosobruchus chinensis]